MSSIWFNDDQVDSMRSDALKAATVSRLGGVGAMAPDLYALALQDIAEQVGSTVSDDFKLQVAAILRDMPCPLD
jgi:hypothetical protein